MPSFFISADAAGAGAGRGGVYSSSLRRFHMGRKLPSKYQD
jgi:hypothetical protein